MKDNATVHFYTPQEIQKIAGPSESDYEGLLLRLREDGFQITYQSPTHLYVVISGRQMTFHRIFGKNDELAVQSLKHSGFLNQKRDLSLIASVTGISPSGKAHPLFVANGAAHAQPMGLNPDTIHSIYDFNPIYQSGISGINQDIAVATYGSFSKAQVQHFFSSFGISPTPMVDQITFNGDPAYDEKSADETELDTELSGMIAPGSRIHVFTSAENSDAGELELFTAILDDSRIKVVNYSWGRCEKSVSPKHIAEMQDVFARAIAQGVNIFVATGDLGSDDCDDGTVDASWPAVDPDVIAVGGTSLRSDSIGNITETAWSESGGGISDSFPQPDYQSVLGNLIQRRAIPDVAFNADPQASGEAIYGQNDGHPAWLTVGGTSMAAPQWAGFLALVNRARARQGEGPEPFLDPLIYGLDPQTRAEDFHDVVSGSNGAYSAAPGWDPVTGWGSMDAAKLLETLVNK